MWLREPGFATLVHIVLEQQVSLASARAAYRRLQVLLSPMTPRGFLALSDASLRSAGFSRQKTRYCRCLATAIVDGSLRLDEVAGMGDDSARDMLSSVTGIGCWTADIYLLMALRRPDIWPSGDLALQIAAQQVLGLDSRPTVTEFEALGHPWRPWRGVAARILWHHYLSV